MIKPTAVFAALVAASLWASAASGHDYTVGAIEIGHPWARATPQGAKVASAYMTLTNTGKETDRLVGGSALVAGRLELHQMSMTGGVMRMRMLQAGLEIKPGETVALKPGSYHMMLLDLEQPFEQGQMVKGTLAFENAGPVEIEYAVEAMGADGAAHDGAHHGK